MYLSAPARQPFDHDDVSRYVCCPDYGGDARLDGSRARPPSTAPCLLCSSEISTMRHYCWNCHIGPYHLNCVEYHEKHTCVRRYHKPSSSVLTGVVATLVSMCRELSSRLFFTCLLLCSHLHLVQGSSVSPKALCPKSLVRLLLHCCLEHSW